MSKVPAALAGAGILLSAGEAVTTRIQALPCADFALAGIGILYSVGETAATRILDM